MSSRKDSARGGRAGRGDKADKDKEKDESLIRMDKQTKLDSIVTQITTESTPSELIALLNSFSQRLDQVASKDYLDKSLKRLVSEDFVRSKLDELKDEIMKEIKSEMRSEFDKINERIKNVNTKLVEQATEVENLKSESSDLKEEIEKLKSENDRLKTKNEEIADLLTQREQRILVNEKEINELEQYTRRNSLRIYGISDNDKNENSRTSANRAVSMIKDKLEVPITIADVDIAHRLGQFRTDGNRPIIIKFISRELKDTVLRHRRKLKGTALVIREDLTTKNAKLLEKVSHHSNVKNAWSDDGKIIALLHSGIKIRVKLNSNLQSLLGPIHG